MYQPLFLLFAMCEVEAYGTQSENVILVSKLQFLFAPPMLLFYMSQQWRRRLVHSESKNNFIHFSSSIEAWFEKKFIYYILFSEGTHQSHKCVRSL